MHKHSIHLGMAAWLIYHISTVPSTAQEEKVILSGVP
jgi:hypothetical protein